MIMREYGGGRWAIAVIFVPKTFGVPNPSALIAVPFIFVNSLQLHFLNFFRTKRAKARKFPSCKNIY